MNVWGGERLGGERLTIVQDLWTERANPSLALCRPALAVSLIDKKFISGWWAGSPERLKL